MESPFTRPLPDIDNFPSSSAEIQVRVCNAIMKRSSTPSLTTSHSDSSASVTFNDASPASTRVDRLAEEHIKTSDEAGDSFHILGPLPVQLMSVSLSSGSTSGSSNSSDQAALASSTKAKPSLNRSKSLPDLRPLGPSVKPSASPVLSIRSMGMKSPSLLCFDDNGVTTREEQVSVSQASGDNDRASDHSDSKTGRPVEIGRDEAISRPRLRPWVMESILRMCNSKSPPPQTVVHRASKRPTLPTILSVPGSPTSPTQHIRRVKERQTTTVFPKSPDFWTDTESEASVSGCQCEGCGRRKTSAVWIRLIPCEHLICSQCFSASISGVTVTRGPSNCPRCFSPTFSMEILGDVKSHIQTLMAPAPEATLKPTKDYPVLRIDNVAWDVTPQIVRDYLPPQVLPYRHPQPIHILLDRFDGRTKDYMYVEVANEEAVRRVLKYRQNSFMPCGPASSGRKRPVTITAVPLYELINELRPRSAAELHGLLALCHAAVDAPYFTHNASGFVVPPVGPAHFVKSRHGPFYAVMSILTRLHGHSSPSYWDTFTSGAIKALSVARYYKAPHLNIDVRSIHEQDRIVLDSLTRLYHQTFHNFNDNHD